MAELKAGIDRSQHLIEQFLEVSSAESQGQGRPMESVDPAEVARSVVWALSVKAEHRGIDLGAGIEAGGVITGHRHQLVTRLTNLVENALRYTPSGGVVDVEFGLHGELPMLRVVDDGPAFQQTNASASSIASIAARRLPPSPSRQATPAAAASGSPSCGPSPNGTTRG